MKCPECNSPTLVEQVRADNGRRRRVCRDKACGHVFHTEEVVVPAHAHGGDRHSKQFKESHGHALNT